MRKEVRHMQRVTPRECSVRTFLALVAVLAASFVTTASIGGATQNAPLKAVHLCPPLC
jgi:energy-converting hydrogenase Eha subunit H